MADRRQPGDADCDRRLRHWVRPRGHAENRPRDRRGAAPSQAAARLRRFFSAAVLSWPQAASMSRPRGVRTGAEMPLSKTMLLNALIRSGSEHSYDAPGQGLNGIKLTFA